MQRRPRRGLVLGAGGALGAAWMLGVLRALRELEDFDPGSADVVVGTSAGAVLGSLFGCGLGLDHLVEEVSAAREPRLGGTGAINVLDVHTQLASIPRPVLLPGNLRLAALSAVHTPRRPLMTAIAGLAPRGRGTLAPIGEMIAAAQRTSSRVTATGWPAEPTVWVVAMDFDTGRRMVFGRSGAPPATLAQAVCASCAAPGYFPPVTIDGRRYVDGGAVSMTNADTVARAELDEVLVLAPMAGRPRPASWSPLARADLRLRQAFSRQASREAARLIAAGMRVRLLAPSPADLAVMGVNVMDPRRRADVLAAAEQNMRSALRRRDPGPAGPRRGAGFVA